MTLSHFRHRLAPELAAVVSLSDDLRHSPPEGGRMRDSLFWQVSLPDEGLCMQAYFYCTGSGKAGYNMCLWGTDLEKPVLHFHQGDVGTETDFSDLTFNNLKIRLYPDDARSSLRYAHKNFELHLDFTGLHDGFSYHANNEGLPEWFAVNRIEQSGLLSGHIQIGERRVSLDGRIGHRDHSWGLRDWRMPVHWKWLSAYTPGAETALNLWIWQAKGEQGIAGYIAKDGVVHPVTSITEKTSYDEKMIHQKGVFDISYGEGQTTRLELTYFSHIQFAATPQNPNVITEVGCAALIDGVAGAGQYETQWFAPYYEQLCGR